MSATQPSGDGTLTPSPLSSQISSSGTGTPERSNQPAALNAAVAAAWLTEASPNEATATASRGHGCPAAGPGQREGQPDGARQVRGHGGGGRDDVQVGAAEDLVPAAGDRFAGRRDDAAQHVPGGVLGLLARAQKNAAER